MSIVYLAGPMRGIPYYNFPAFDEARDSLMSRGHVVLSPADMDRKVGFEALDLPDNTDWEEIPDGFSFPACVNRDIEAVKSCDVIFMLHGWEKSKGAMAEKAIAEWMGKSVWYEPVCLKPFAIEPSEKEDFCSPSAYIPPRTVPSNGEVMTANEKTGGKKGTKPVRFDLMPAKALQELAYHYGINVTDHGGKYPPNNWRKGFEWSKAYAAIQRHAHQFWAGEDIDKDSGSKHVIAIAFHALALATWMDTHRELDDRAEKMEKETTISFTQNFVGTEH